MDASNRNQIFISYSHRDKLWLERLQIMLKPLVREGELIIWDDTKIRVGTQWQKEIENALKSAGVAVMLVSPDFLASDFIATVELPFLLAAATNRGLQVCWVLVSACLYETSGISLFQAAHDISQPLDSLTASQLNVILSNVAREIKLLTSTALPNQQTNIPVSRPREAERQIVSIIGKKVFRMGDRIRIYRWAGTFKKAETGFPFEVQGDIGRTGTVIGIGERIDLIKIQWDDQEWSTTKLLFRKGEKYRLHSFTATINAAWIEVIGQ